MRRFYGFLVAGFMLAAFSVVNVPTALAQDDPKTELYNKFLGCRKETDTAKRDACAAVAKEFMQKHGADNDEYSAYVGKWVVKYDKEKADEAVYIKFNTSVNSKNWDDAFASGKQILAMNPENIDVMLVLASIGFDNATAVPPVDKYNTDALNMAKMAIQKIEKGATSETFGAFKDYTYKNKAFPDGKSNALGWMNYTIGMITFYNLKMKKDALPYLYKTTQFNTGAKDSMLYRTVGSYYLDEVVRMESERQAKIKANGDQDNEETTNMYALQKGYAERGADAYARAYKIASGVATATKEFKDTLLNRAKELYSFRFDKNMSGFDAYIAGTATRPFPDPTTAVTPVELPKPAETTTGTTTTPVTTTTTPATTTTKPATTTTTPATTKPATTTPATTTPATITKPAAKKPAAKKPVAKKKKV